VSENFQNGNGARLASRRVCTGCGKKEGDTYSDGVPIKVEEVEGELLCLDCAELLAPIWHCA